MSQQLKELPKRKRGNTSFVTRLQLLIDEAGSQNKLAERSGITQAVISKWRNGADPQAETLVAFANSMKLSLNWLLMGHGPRELRPNESAKLEDQLGEYFRMRLSAHDYEPGSGRKTRLHTAVAMYDNHALGRAILELVDARLPDQVRDMARRHRRVMATQAQLIPLNDAAEHIPKSLMNRLLGLIEESMKPGPIGGPLEGLLLKAMTGKSDPAFPPP